VIDVSAGVSKTRTGLALPLRVRLLPFVRRFSVDPDAVLEVLADPRLDLVAIDSAKIGSARGSTWMLPTAAPQPLLVDAAGRPVLGKAAWLIPVRFPESKTPAELTGVIEARFLVRRPCATVPSPIAAAGKTIVGQRGVALSVREAQVSEDGRATLTVHLDHYDGLLASGPGDHLQRVRPGLVLARDPLATLLDGLELQDERGRPLPREELRQLDAHATGVTYRATFSSVPPDARGLRLVLMARQTVRVQVEFTLAK
jgi:hypothetical protein